MDKDSLKIYLKDNPEYIRDILEDLGCGYVHIGRKRVNATRPDGDNRGAIAITLNDFLSTRVWTKNEFNKYKIQDFYTLITYLSNYSFSEVMTYVHRICGLAYDGHFEPKEISASANLLKRFKRVNNRNLEDLSTKETILDEKIKEEFFRQTCKKWLDDGVTEETQAKFEVSYDVVENRIVFPIRNYEGKLISIKGRTLDADYLIKGIPKFISYYNYYAEYYLYGWYENYEEIKKGKEVYIGEAEKFVQQLDSVGYHNALSVSKKTISPYQVTKLLQLGKDIIICFDNDVSEEEIKNECRKFRGLCNVYYVKDENNLLGKKDSPSDKGLDIFEKLVENKILFKE